MAREALNEPPVPPDAGAAGSRSEATPERGPGDRESSALDHSEGRLAYVDEGPRDAPAVLAVHGIPGSVRDFRYLAPHLTDRVRFVRVDLPGFGGSSPLRSATDSLPARAGVLVSLADHLGLARFGILGHSMGGGTALALAAEHPRRVELLVLVASVALSRHRGLGLSPRTFGWLARGLRLPLLGSWLARYARKQYRRRGFGGVEEMTARDFARHFQSIAALDYGQLRRIIEGPLPATLIAYARDDRMVETWISEELVAALPKARVLAFDEGGHNLQKSRAAELAAAIKACLGV
jgi:pimeloyl-ACP methyl ester carboxylesterase